VKTLESLDLVNWIDKDELDKHVKVLSGLERLTGEPGAEEAVDYIITQLEQYGVPNHRYQFDGFFSDPVHGEVVVHSANSFRLKAKARSFSKHCPDGVRAAIVYDESSERNADKAERPHSFAHLKGKIVISWNYYEDYVKEIEQAGAIGLIHIWPSKEEDIHEETVGTVWGTPTIENKGQLTKIPVVGVNYQEGTNLLQHMKQEDVSVSLITILNEGVKNVSLPVASIAGEEGHYLLISGHYDSWHKGATDNAVANALLLELARLFSKDEVKVKRGIKLAWWPGHSNGRYAGSAWYCDHFWEELNEKCVAHINVDFPGSKGNEVIIPRSTSMEEEGLLEDIIETHTGEKSRPISYLPRGADQSFWGTNIPIHLMLKYEPINENKQYQTPGGNWWWHTEADLYDKVDLELLVRDTKIHTALVYELADIPILPLQLTEFIKKSKNIMEEIDSHSDKIFDFSALYHSLNGLKDKVMELLEHEIRIEEEYNQLLKVVGGTLNRLMYSYSSKYEYDNTFPFQPFPGLAKVKDVYQKDITPETLLFTNTFFVRQRNRFVQEVRVICKEINRYLDSLDKTMGVITS
jgi:aminopeptidase YwaD